MAGRFKTTDSGERERFSTGAHRDTRSGKGRFDLLPVFALERDAGLLERGAEKYDARNWEKGFQFSRCLDSAIRHLVEHLQGESVEDHLAAARFNIACVMHYEEMIRRGLMDPALNDLPNYSPVLPSTVRMPNEEVQHTARPTNPPDVPVRFSSLGGWTCWKCNSLNDVGDAECWSCSTSRTAADPAVKQPPEEIIEIDEDGTVHSLGRAPAEPDGGGVK